MSPTESFDELLSPLTTIVSIPDSIPSDFTVSSLKRIDEETYEDDYNQMLMEKRRSAKTSSMADVIRRFRQRKELQNRLCVVSNAMCCLGLLGVFLMIIENEITFVNVLDKDTIFSWFIKLIITITTIILVTLVFYYHHLDLSLYSITNSTNNLLVGITKTKIFLILFEAFICSIHPIPRSFPQESNVVKHENSPITNSISKSYISIDVALDLPMFARVYLICRYMIRRSHLLLNATSQSMGCFNRVPINFFFLIKTYLDQWPARCILIVCTFLFLIGSWSLRACNYTPTYEHATILDSMWLFVVTFTTVGYGDLTPPTYCGRSVAAITGLSGVLSTALLISVLAQKFELTRSEKYVHNFVLNIDLAKKRKNQAANIVKFSILVWYLKRKHRSTSIQYIKARRTLIRSVHFYQQIKREQAKRTDNCVGLLELLTIQRETSDTTTLMKSKVDQIEEKLVDMNQTMMNIQNTLTCLLNRMT